MASCGASICIDGVQQRPGWWPSAVSPSPVTSPPILARVDACRVPTEKPPFTVSAGAAMHDQACRGLGGGRPRGSPGTSCA